MCRCSSEPASKGKREIELLVAELAPKPDVPNRMRKLPEASLACHASERLLPRHRHGLLKPCPHRSVPSRRREAMRAEHRSHRSAACSGLVDATQSKSI